ncbi:MAG: DUF4446 family protein [Lachnospiraceae bacterium]|nr:DUF4446 family protein [Lachnospiraceae bacterium]
MSSRIFEAIGLGGMDLAIPFLIMLIAVIALIVVVIMQMKKQDALRRRYERFMQGSEAMSLEDEMQRLAGDVSRLKKESKAYANDIDLLFNKHEGALQKLGLVKYDAFAEMGGRMSFVLALLDERNSGVIINSVHSSTGCYSYAKRVTAGRCETNLSPEETEAMNKAIGQQS